jgi:hypothetical protein
MKHLAPQSLDDWLRFREPRYVGALDCTREQLAAAYGWTWDEVDEEGLGLMSYLFLAWDGTSRFTLSISTHHPDEGVHIEIDGSRDADPEAALRAFLDDLGLTHAAMLAIQVGDTLFARWDPDQHGVSKRPATAFKRPFAS